MAWTFFGSDACVSVPCCLGRPAYDTLRSFAGLEKKLVGKSSIPPLSDAPIYIEVKLFNP